MIETQSCALTANFSWGSAGILSRLESSKNQAEVSEAREFTFGPRHPMARQRFSEPLPGSLCRAKGELPRRVPRHRPPVGASKAQLELVVGDGLGRSLPPSPHPSELPGSVQPSASSAPKLRCPRRRAKSRVEWISPPPSVILSGTRTLSTGEAVVKRALTASVTFFSPDPQGLPCPVEEPKLVRWTSAGRPLNSGGRSRLRGPTRAWE